MCNPGWLFSTFLLQYRQQIFLSLCIPLLLALLVASVGSEPEPDTKSLSAEAAIDSLLCVAHRLEGIAYRPGGKDEAGFDCSGYTRYVYGQLGVQLNASAATQYGQGVAVHPDSLRQGDLVFFQKQDGRIFHVGLYAGEEEGKNAFLHASSSRGIVKDYLEMPYFRQRWKGARRIIP